MNKIAVGLMLGMFVFGGKAFALGLDVGPVHVHTKGSTQQLKLIVDTIVKDKDGDAVIKLHAHRNGGDDKFEIKIVLSDLDDTSKNLLRNTLKTGVIYDAHLEKLENDWKLLKLRENDEK